MIPNLRLRTVLCLGGMRGAINVLKRPANQVENRAAVVSVAGRPPPRSRDAGGQP